MNLQHERELNQTYPIGYIPYMPFLPLHSNQFDIGANKAKNPSLSLLLAGDNNNNNNTVDIMKMAGGGSGTDNINNNNNPTDPTAAFTPQNIQQELTHYNAFVLPQIPTTREILKTSIVKKFKCYDTVASHSTSRTLHPFFDGTYDKDSGIGLPNVLQPAVFNDIDLYEQKGNYFIAEKYDKLYVSPENMLTEPYDLKFDILSQKHFVITIKTYP
eukprot:UN00791